MFNLEQLPRQLEQNYFQIYYYPQYEFTSKKIIGAETAVHYHFGTITIDYKEFQGELEAKELTGILDIWVLDQVCQLQKHMIAAQRAVIPVVINVSAWTLCNPYQVYDIALIMKKYDLPQNLVLVAITNKLPCEVTYGLQKGLLFLQRQGLTLYDMKQIDSVNDSCSAAKLHPAPLTQEEFCIIQRDLS